MMRAEMAGFSFYSAPDLRHWTFRSKIFNGFFECPDMYQLPVDGNAGNKMWVLNDASGGYHAWPIRWRDVHAQATSKLPCNFGSGFYASQTFYQHEARGQSRWCGLAWAQITTPAMPFNQLMYFPTTLTLQTTSNGVRLCSTPIAEITNNAVAID